MTDTDRLTRDARLDAIADLAADLAGRFALEPLLERILRNTLELLDCESGSVCTVDEAAGTYRKEVDLGVGCGSGQTYPLDEGVTGEIIRARSSVVFDEYADVRGGHIAEPDRRGLHGVIGVPILWGDAIIGSCVVFSRDPSRRFSREDATLVELFATHAAIAITNARLHTRAAEKDREAAVLAERERAMRDVHDTVGRGLADVARHLDAVERALADGTEPANALGAARTAARSALSETQRSVLGLDPALLEGRSLGDAVALELAWVESTAAVRTRLVVAGEPRPLAPDTARQVLRIVQEALTNVVEHARARNVRVGFVYSSSDVTVLVEDDGRGFDVAAVAGRELEQPHGSGLAGIAARVERLGGTLALESTPQWGTRIRAALPLGPAARAARTARWRVVVVHESPVFRAGLVRTLSQLEPDIQVVGEFADASAAVDAYDVVRPDAVLAQLDLPRVDGVQLTAYLKAVDPVASIVLLIPGVGDERVHAAARIGAAGFVERDAEPADITRAVVAAARGDALLSTGLLGRFAASVVAAPDPLTARERQVRALVERGLPDKRIAADLDISVKTVEKHVGAILRKTGAANRTALAARSGLRQG